MTPSSTEHNTTPSSFVPRPTTTLQTFLPEFWSHVIRHAEQYQSNFKDGQLPLARIKKLVKSDPDIKMIANEVTVLLDKACEIFINEITVRSFLVANSLNRRTVNLSDVAMAISQSDMFDFLIDIVPNEQPTEDNSNMNVPSTSALPTAACTSATTSKQKQKTSSQLPQQSDQQQSQSDCSGQPSKPTSTLESLPSAKKKKKTSKVNRNLLPEEIAVPIPDEELVQHGNARSVGQNLNSTRRLLAIPIPDSELIPPQSSTPSWEMAIPITTQSQVSSSRVAPSLQNRSWEMAVPITDAMPNWEMAVQISDHDSSHHLTNLSLNPSNKRKRTWDLAVPIVDEDNGNNQSSLSRVEQSLNNNDLNYQSQYSNSITSSSNQVTTWELAVPITDQGTMEGTSHQTTQSNSVQINSTQVVPIDPALFNLSSSIKVEPNPSDPQISLPFHTPPVPPNFHQQNDVEIKQED